MNSTQLCTISHVTRNAPVVSSCKPPSGVTNQFFPDRETLKALPARMRISCSSSPYTRSKWLTASAIGRQNKRTISVIAVSSFLLLGSVSYVDRRRFMITKRTRKKPLLAVMTLTLTPKRGLSLFSCLIRLRFDAAYSLPGPVFPRCARSSGRLPLPNNSP